MLHYRCIYTIELGTCMFVICTSLTNDLECLSFCCLFYSYNRWLCRARAEDLSDIAALKALYQTGQSFSLWVSFMHFNDVCFNCKAVSFIQ